MVKRFTVAEANALVPQLKRWFEEIWALDRRLMVLREQHEAVLRRRDSANVGGGELSEYLLLSWRWRELIEGILALGVQIKDVSRGLCDFPHRPPGGDEDVLLCWEAASEDSVAHWHSWHGGYMARQPLRGQSSRLSH